MFTVLDIVLYSNDSFFLSEFSRELSAELGDYTREFCRLRKMPLFQTSLYDGTDPPPDLCVVDIRDDPERGMGFVRNLRRNAGTEVIITAPGPEWAMAAYDADVLSYLLSPPDASRTAKIILRRFSQRFQHQSLQFPFRTSSGMQMLAAERIVYMEYSNHRMLIYTDSGKQMATSTMRSSFGEAVSQLLDDPRFVRTHASFLVNITHVSQFGHYVLIMDTGASVPVSHAKKPQVKKRINEFFSSRQG